jgi:hypothetical protein
MLWFSNAFECVRDDARAATQFLSFALRAFSLAMDAHECMRHRFAGALDAKGIAEHGKGIAL